HHFQGVWFRRSDRRPPAAPRVPRSSWLTGALFAGLFLALHLPFLPPSLEDLDSINFALGVRDYDVSRHQPHPPGYPLFIVDAKTLHRVRLSEDRALSIVSVLGVALGILGCFALFQALERTSKESYGVSGFPPPPKATARLAEAPFGREGGSRTYSQTPWLAALLVITCPLYWITAA